VKGQDDRGKVARLGWSGFNSVILKGTGVGDDGKEQAGYHRGTFSIHQNGSDGQFLNFKYFVFLTCRNFGILKKETANEIGNGKWYLEI
jgi:hypothetical protein